MKVASALHPFMALLTGYDSVISFLAGPHVGSTLSSPRMDVIPATRSHGESKVEFISSATGLDAPKVLPITDPTWDFWYFDTLSDDGKSAFSIAFFAVTNVSMPLFPSTSDVIVDMWALFENGTTYDSGPLAATQGIVVSAGQGSSGDWQGTGFRWAGTPDLSEYMVAIDSAEAGVQGLVTFHSIAPARYPCGPAVAGQSMEALPNLGWDNAMPDADSVVNLNIHGEAFSFTGSGYHDKSWGSRPFNTLVNSWYWGRTRLGPYSIIWLDAIDSSGEEHTIGYVAQNGEILTTNCVPGATKIRPTGENSQYPPRMGHDPPSSFHVEIDAGDTTGKLVFDVEVTAMMADIPGVNWRWVGSVNGGLEGGPVYQSVAMFEQFALA